VSRISIPVRHHGPRWTGEQLCFVEEPDLGIVWPAHVTELSARGARLSAQRRWEVDTVLSVQFPAAGEYHTAALKVTRSQENDTGQAVACGVFLKPLPAHVLGTLLGYPQDSGTFADSPVPALAAASAGSSSSRGGY
jgi:hypothetical protein